MSPRSAAPDDASGEIPRPTRELPDDAPTLRRMLRPDLTPRSLRRADDVEARARRSLAADAEPSAGAARAASATSPGWTGCAGCRSSP